MTMPTFRKLFFSFLLFISIIFLPVLSSQAQPPEVSTPLENKLFKGSIDEITAFIGQQQAEIEQIIIEIDKTADKNTGQKIQGSATAVKDLFQGLSLQNKILLTELSRTLSGALKQPTIEGPPYSIQNFDKIIAFQRQVSIQQTENSKRFALLQSRLISLKESAVGQLSEYAKLMKTDADNHLLLYERYGKLLNLQSEYALLKIKKPKLEKRLTELSESKKIAATWVKDAFTNIKVTPEDINQAQKLQDKRQSLFKSKTEATSAEYQQLNSRVLIYEARLDAALTKLDATKENNLKESLRAEKERIELILDALKLRIHLINQTRLNCEIKILKSNFRLQWLKNYELEGEQNRLTDFIKEWSPEIDKLERKQEATTTSISTVTLARSSLTHKLVTIHNQKDAAKTPQLREALATLTRQADKVNENIDKLILALSENDQDIRNAKREIEQIIDLSNFAISRSERIRTWSALYLAGFQERVQSVIYYPLFSIGTSAITLHIILKIVLLLFAGVVCIRLLRRQVARLLEKKMGMSIGAINSITTLGYYISLLLGTLIILSTAGLDLSQLSIILGALGVGIGFGLQTITNNFISGIILLTEQSIKVGDYVHLGDGLVGEVKKMTIRTTIVHTVEGEDIIVPNSDFISNRVNTWTYGD
ncbi:MAG: mechanosensitive ion channel, partial [Deltaproteobacteria bacterium]|nr:mechanosensitive ion channel [Candidatus Tharpella aukensis]